MNRDKSDLSPLSRSVTHDLEKKSITMPVWWLIKSARVWK